MSEKGPSINMSSFESNFTIGKVEEEEKGRIESIANEILEKNILEKDQFKNEEEREVQANKIIEKLGFPSYKEMMDARNDKNRPESKAKDSFNVLKKATALAMNSKDNRKLQTNLNLGKEDNIKEALPNSWNYVHPGSLEIILSEGIIESVITDPDILKGVRKLDKMRKRTDFSKWNERRDLAVKVEDYVGELLDMDVSDEKEDELMAVKCYLSGEAEILREKIIDNKDFDNKDVEAVLEKNEESEPVIRNKESELTDQNKKSYNLNNLNLRDVEVPESPEDQLKLARIIMDYVEVKWIYSYDNISPEIDYLKKIKESSITDDNVKKEIGFRLALNDTYMSAYSGDGVIGESIGRDREGSIDYIANVLGEGGGITADFIDFFGFGGKEASVKDFKVTDAWNLLQTASLNYKSLIKDAIESGYFNESNYGDSKEEFMKLSNIIKGPLNNPDSEAGQRYNEMFGYYGEVNFNWFWDGDKPRQGMMRDYMVDRLSSEVGITKEVAEKSFDLAEKTYFSTGENQYSNEDFTGEATMAKRAKIGMFRKGDWSKGKKCGPVSTLNAIESCGTSYFRMIANKGKYGEDIIGLRDKLLAKDVVSKNTKGKYGYYLWGTTLNVNKFGLAYQSFMDKSFDLDKLVEPDSLASKLDAFNKLVDYIPNAISNMSSNENSSIRKAENSSKARAWYITGQIENALRDNVELNLLGLQKMYYHLVASKNIPVIKDGIVDGETSFISQEQWDKIMKELGVYKKLRIKAKLVQRFTGK